MRILTYLMLLLIILLGLTFASLNATRVTVNYYIGQANLPLALLILIVLFIGVALGFLIALRTIIRCKKELFQLRHRVKVADKEIQNLRVIPVKDA